MLTELIEIIVDGVDFVRTYGSANNGGPVTRVTDTVANKIAYRMEWEDDFSR